MNVGLSHAKGEYIGILESDDFADSNMFEELYLIAKKNNLDVVKSDFYLHEANNKSETKKAHAIPTSLLNKVLTPSENPDVFMLIPSIWSSIYKNSFLQENKIKFQETPGASFQDTGFVFQAMSLAKTAYFTEKAYLHYRIDNPNSSSNNNDKKVFCVNHEYNAIYDFLNSRPKLKKDLLQTFMILRHAAYTWNLERLNADNQKKFLAKIQTEYQDSFKKGEFDRKSLSSSLYIRLLLIAKLPMIFTTIKKIKRLLR